MYFLLNPISHSQMLNAVELVGMLCKIYLGAIIVILIFFYLIKMHIFNCIDLFFAIQWASVALAAPWVGLKETSLGTPVLMNKRNPFDFYIYIYMLNFKIMLTY